MSGRVRGGTEPERDERPEWIVFEPWTSGNFVVVHADGEQEAANEGLYRLACERQEAGDEEPVRTVVVLPYGARKMYNAVTSAEVSDFQCCGGVEFGEGDWRHSATCYEIGAPSVVGCCEVHAPHAGLDEATEFTCPTCDKRFVRAPEDDDVDWVLAPSEDKPED